MSEREYYGLRPENTGSHFEMYVDPVYATGYVIGFTWEPVAGQGCIWVNWFIADAWSMDNENTFVAKRGSLSSPPLPECELPPERWKEAEFIAFGSLKWDGCAQWECDVHLDGNRPRRFFFDAVHFAHRKAAELMDHFEGPTEDA